jgi:hypothetical protein
VRQKQQIQLPACCLQVQSAERLDDACPLPAPHAEK